LQVDNHDGFVVIDSM